MAKTTKTIKTSKEFASIAEARCHYLLKGYRTIESSTESCLMTKHDGEGNKLGEVIINREGFMLVESCETRFLQVSAEEIFKVV